ncbi:MAG: OmpA family protein [Rhodobacterales bacterium]|jgi:outer membrane protein OmpA-like peptidoglycan-associated protein
MMPITLSIAKSPVGRLIGLLLMVLGVLAGRPLVAADLALPKTARVVLQEVTSLGEYAVPTGPWRNGMLPQLKVQGTITRQAWHAQKSGKTSLQILLELRRQLTDQQYSVLYDCQDRGCGGFDFRFGTEVFPGPTMYVDLNNYRFLSAVRKQDTGAKTYITLLVSQSAQSDYVQSIHLSEDQNETFQTLIDPMPGRAIPSVFYLPLETAGFVILSDLEFKSGSATLADKAFASLQTLAKYLKNNPNRIVALVGHSDSIGDLDRNIALSKQRAEAVAQYLVQHFEIISDQIIAAGTGYLSPVASNLTVEGRKQNRRVEAVLISHQ